MAFIGTNILKIERDTLGFWYLTDTMTGDYVSPPIRREELARNLWSRAEGLLHGGRVTLDQNGPRGKQSVFEWARDALAAEH